MPNSRYSNFSLEYSLLDNGCKFVAGMDEVGRGCLAGPVVAAIVVISGEDQYILGVWDSKIMTKKRREDVYDKILDIADGYGIGESSCGEVDKLGISQAAALAMSRAYELLDFQPDIVLVDGEYVRSPNLRSLKIKEGDSKHFVISAASIVAKVYRDRLMIGLAKKFCGYGFERNVGYGTKEHRDAIAKIGVCEIHRRSFSPVRNYLDGGECEKDSR